MFRQPYNQAERNTNVKRGRPRDEYPHGEFRGVVLQELTRRSLSLRVLELWSGVNRGTLSAVLNGKRPCERGDRSAILNALGLLTEKKAVFVPGSEQDRILLDGRPARHEDLQHGQRFMSRAQFAEAHDQFRRVFEAAVASGDTTLQAEAAGFLGWFHGELERFDDARRWLIESIRLIEGELGMKTDEIVNSVKADVAMSAMSERQAQILSRALRIYCKVLTVRIVHDLDYRWQAEVKRVFQQSIRLDERLRLPELPHNLRWRAVAASAEDRSTLRDVDTLLSQSRELMPSGSAGEASLIREQGVVRWQKGRLLKAEELLADAKERLIDFADARALGPTLCTLSKVTLQGNGNSRLAQRYALLAASLHPYGYVLDHCVEQLKRLPVADRMWGLDDVLAGAKPFDTIHTMLDRVANGSPNSGLELVQRNLARVRRAVQAADESRG